ncbi:Na+/H+ antiporter [Agromyces sp. ISL-38]|uniref:Na+/H+ antiporter n=1 Tax=Agromyces sp. ISL-38 TaxID=2819107 RepID=UPI001BEB171C|nr:Na+/H+ antiporter [Agromyces sp. ISL-38]MBT2498754.1 Na+/H+ antiporter [Agromyces sp. ISL-38]
MHLGEIFMLLAGSLAVTAFARWRGWSAPLLVMVVAFIVSVLPFVPAIVVDGELVLTLVLPPLLYSSALEVTYLDFRRSFGQIRRLGIMLPIVTAFAVGFVVWLIAPSLGLPVALLIGAIAAPSDAVSAAAVGRRLGLPRRVMTVLSGESLVNDATAITLFRTFAAIAAGATVTWFDGILSFLVAVVVGVGLGLVIGWLVTILRTRLDDAAVLGTVSLLLPFAAYGIAERLGGSGVLAVVASGILIGHHAPRTSYATRQHERPIWQSIDVLLEGLVFGLIGLQLSTAVADVLASDLGLGTNAALALAVLGTVIVVRIVWVSGGYAVSRRIDAWLAPVRTRRGRRHLAEPKLAPKELIVISWAGMRGVVTLATATAIPAIPDDPAAADTVFLVAFVVTVGTLLLQSTTLPLIIKRLHVADDDEREQDRREIRAVLQRSAAEGLAYIENRRGEWHERYGTELTDSVIDRFVKRIRADATRSEDLATDAAAATVSAQAELSSISRDWIAARRRVVLAERDAGHLNEEVMRELLFALDAEELALDSRAAVRDDARGETP